MPPAGEWPKWILRAGRGFGKTRVGAEMTTDWARSNTVRRIHLVGRTASDVRDTMIEGESGVLACSHPNFRPAYEPSKRRLTWPNGCRATTFSGEEPDALRGPQCEKAWADELASWKYPDAAWSNLMFGLRLGRLPQVVITTTPRPIKLIGQLLRDPHCVVTSGSSYANRANLADSYWTDVIAPYIGTRVGRQEVEGEYLEDVPGALWTRDLIDAGRVAALPSEVGRLVVAVDPATTSGEESDETGIVVGARGVGAMAQHAYILKDLSGRHPVADWPRIVVAAMKTHRGDRVVAEVNNGGDMVEATLRVVDPSVSYRSVHASRGKRVRAEPVAALYEQGRIHHVGSLPKLEDEMCNFVPDAGPQELDDRVDALVYCVTDLLLGTKFMIA